MDACWTGIVYALFGADIHAGLSRHLRRRLLFNEISDADDEMGHVLYYAGEHYNNPNWNCIS